MRIRKCRSLGRIVTPGDARLDQRGNMLIARRHHIGIELAASRLGQEPVRDSFACRAVAIEFDAVAFIEVDAQPLEMIRADIAINNCLAFRPRTCDKPFLPLVGWELQQLLPDLFGLAREAACAWVCIRVKNPDSEKISKKASAGFHLTSDHAQ